MLVSTMRRREPLVYGRDWDYKPVVVPPSEAQFVEAMRMNASQIAAVLHLPPERIGGSRSDSLTYSNVEQGALQIIEALRPWLVRLEHSFFDLLPERRYTRFNADALLKTDTKTRTEIYKAQREMGMRNVDELRDLEDLAPLPAGQGNENIPLEVMVAMARSIRGIPKSMMPQVVLEMDLAADKLQELEGQGLAKPDIPGMPVIPSSSQMLGQVIASQRSRDPDERDDANLIMDFLAARRTARNSRPRNEPEFVGAWIPDKSDLVLNGNGRH